MANFTRRVRVGGDKVTVGDGLEWLRETADHSASMVYCDPPFGHGTFGRSVKLDWIVSLVYEGMRVVGPDGIVYLHGDPELLFAVAPLLPSPRGVIAWANGWVSGFKSKSRRFWPRQYQLIGGWAGNEWSLRPVRRPKSEYRATKSRPSPSDSFVYSDWWSDPNPVDQMSYSKEKTGWPTQKPIVLLERLILGSTDMDQLVLDPSCGSGTSLLAAKRLGRGYAGCDISADAVTIAQRRLEEDFRD